MKAIIKKSDLTEAAKALNRLTKDVPKVFIKANDVDVQIICTTPTYMRFTIPAEVKKKGIAAIDTVVFDRLLSCRKSELSIELVSNTLKVDAGTKLTLYTLDLGKEPIEPPFEDLKGLTTFTLTGVNAARLNSMLSKTKFKDLHTNNRSSCVRLFNSKKGVELGCADPAHCAFTVSKEPISKKDVSIVLELGKFKDAMGFVNEKCKVMVDDGRKVYLHSGTIICELDAVTDEEETIEEAQGALAKKMYKKGTIVFKHKDIVTILKSMSIVAGSGDTIIFSTKKTSAVLSMDTQRGKSKDKMDLESNDLGNIELEIPVVLLNEALESCSIAETVIMSVAKEENFFKMEASTKEGNVACITPVRA